MRDSQILPNPYKGLTPYSASASDAQFFFGREAERDTVAVNLLGARFTLVYGKSGVGKSSLLNAGVAHHLRELAHRKLEERNNILATLQEALGHGDDASSAANLEKPEPPDYVVVTFDSWRDDPVGGLARRIGDTVTEAVGLLGADQTPPSDSLTETLSFWSKRASTTLLLILDQFEEYFLYHPREGGERTFAAELPKAVNSLDLRAKFLISIREDALAQLDLFKGRIPNLFHNHLRIEHLRRKAAIRAIEGPVDVFNRLYLKDEKRKIVVEPGLTEEVLNQVETGNIHVGDLGRGKVAEQPGDRLIETPYLQIVMTRLWDEEMRAGSRVLRVKTLKKTLGGAQRIVETHLKEVMAGKLTPRERDVAAQVFYYLVTPSGSKIALTLDDLKKYTGLPLDRIKGTLEKLSTGDVRILRPVSTPPDDIGRHSYEVFHDVLSAPILAWRTQTLQAQYVGLSGTILLLTIIGLFSLASAYLLLQIILGQELHDRLAQGTARFSFLTWAFLISQDARLILMTALAGALGSSMGALQLIYRDVSHRELAWRWVLQYILQPFGGAVLGTVFYLVMRGLFFSPRATVSDLNPYSFIAVSAMAGLVFTQTLAKITQVAQAVFGDSPTNARDTGMTRRGGD